MNLFEFRSLNNEINHYDQKMVSKMFPDDYIGANRRTMSSMVLTQKRILKLI